MFEDLHVYAYQTMGQWTFHVVRTDAEADGSRHCQSVVHTTIPEHELEGDVAVRALLWNIWTYVVLAERSPSREW